MKGQSANSSSRSNGKPAVVSVSGELQSVIRDLIKVQSRWDRMEDRRTVLERVASRLDNPLQDMIKEVLGQAADYDPSPVDLVGPTGESNRLSLHGRGVILCAGADAISLASMALLTGNSILVADATAESEKIIDALEAEKAPKGLVRYLDEELTPGLVTAIPLIGGVSLSAGGYDLRAYRQALAAREGAIIPLIIGSGEWQSYVAERALCIDTTASGGNTKLLAANEA